MSDNVEDLVESIKRNDTWLRVVFMIAFSGVLYIIIAPVIFVLMLAQFAFVLTGGKTNDNLSEFSNSLIQYVSGILRFVTYESEEKPFPFGDFPEPSRKKAAADSGAAEQVAAQPTPDEVASTDSKSATKKTKAKKTPAKKTAKKKAATKKSAAAETPTVKAEENNDEGEGETGADTAKH